MLYAELRACERAGIPFPGTDGKPWDQVNWWVKIVIIAYNQIRCMEEAEDAAT